MNEQSSFSNLPSFSDRWADSFPIFLFGPSGSGKSEVADYLASQLLLPHESLFFFKATDLYRDFVDALELNEVSEFRKSLRSDSLIIIDNFEELETRFPIHNELSYWLDNFPKIIDGVCKWALTGDEVNLSLWPEDVIPIKVIKVVKGLSVSCCHGHSHCEDIRVTVFFGELSVHDIGWFFPETGAFVVEIVKFVFDLGNGVGIFLKY